MMDAMMATIDFSMDSRVKKSYVPLVSQQCHLRHIQRIAARNIRLTVTPQEPHELNGKSSDSDIGFWFSFVNTNEEVVYESSRMEVSGKLFLKTFNYQ
ncbi:unnamed protein product [Oppiella nova]|uniref:Uncharacterized protein n=1 Tax=Oppiella nova TaxID=334625 RepID=A0A7R9L9Q5_9ACAR|nr:unnamed protein product [Oppiella nova]CAG2161170.1 unnamed protein product [Oppiella nova]